MQEAKEKYEILLSDKEVRVEELKMRESHLKNVNKVCLICTLAANPA